MFEFSIDRLRKLASQHRLCIKMHQVPHLIICYLMSISELTEVYDSVWLHRRLRRCAMMVTKRDSELSTFRSTHRGLDGADGDLHLAT